MGNIQHQRRIDIGRGHLADIALQIVKVADLIRGLPNQVGQVIPTINRMLARSTADFQYQSWFSEKVCQSFQDMNLIIISWLGVIPELLVNIVPHPVFRNVISRLPESTEPMMAAEV